MKNPRPAVTVLYSIIALLLAAANPALSAEAPTQVLAPSTPLDAPSRDMSPTPIWHVEGPEGGDYYGYSVATAGDVNGDGYSDVIVGARNYSNPEVYEGAAFLYLGSAEGLSTTPAWTKESNQIGAGFGVSVAPAGDVNNDGYDDVIIGADTYDMGQFDEGVAFVYLGSSSGLSPDPVWIGQMDQEGAQFGFCVATAGDVNGDGYDDILVGAPFYDMSLNNDGLAILYFGAAYGVESDPAWGISSGQAAAGAGRSVATAGDVNGDGYADIIIGADRFDSGHTDCGRAWVFLGSAQGITGGSVWTGTGSVDGDHFGWCVGPAGDTNGDGYADVFVGAPDADGTLVDQGRVYIYRGTSTGIVIGAYRTLSGVQSGERFGTSAAPAGDTNGDSFPDLIVGARSYNGGQVGEGRAYLFEGSIEGTSTTPVWTSEIDQDDARYGSSVATAGDVNGDGFGDVIVGTWAYDTPEVNAGGAWAFAGSAEGLSDTQGWVKAGDQAGAQFGTGVACAGDVNGDGFSDVVVGAPYYESVVPDAGKAWEYLGFPITPYTTENWSAVGEEPDDHFGMEVAAAGDVNGDGYGDLLVSAPHADYEGNFDAGKVYLYLGSENGLEDNFVWMQAGDAHWMNLGLSIAGAGDVNGDGYADVIVGALGYMDGGLSKGGAYLYFGSPSGLSSAPVWNMEGIPGSHFGCSVAGAGDVNGDGFSDVIIGGTNEDVPGGGIGQAFIYLGNPEGLTVPPAWLANLGQVGDGYGSSVCGAGDMNGDGYDDVIVGAPTFTQSGYPDHTGAVAVYLGSPSGMNTSPYWFTWCDQADAHMGAVVRSAGDVNGDGYSDVAFSAPDLDNGLADAGCVWVKLGSSAGPTGFIDAWWDGTQANERFGAALGGPGDVNGDGFDDLIVGSPGYAGPASSGMVRIYFGNDRNLSYRGFPSIPRQQQRSDWAPIDLLGRSEDLDGFLLAAVGQSSAGRTRVRLEWQAAEQGTPLSSLPIEQGAWTVTNAPMPDYGSYVAMTAPVVGLAEDTPCHWRLRVASRSPFFPWTPWTSMPGTVPAQRHVRTGRNTDGVGGEPVAGASDLRLEIVRPNPFVQRVTLVYALPAAGPTRVTIHDASGRLMRTLVDGWEDAGRHVALWDGRDGGGKRLAAGVYLARVESAGTARTMKVVRSQ